MKATCDLINTPINRKCEPPQEPKQDKYEFFTNFVLKNGKKYRDVIKNDLTHHLVKVTNHKDKYRGKTIRFNKII